MWSFKPVFKILLLFLWIGLSQKSYAQTCTTLGQNPATAFPVCGTTTFEQDDVPICSSNDLFVPGCADGAEYANKNPFWYKFTCFVSGSFGFVITPRNLNDDYDWQLYDITGLDPDQVYTNRNIIVSGNWSGSSGATGASANGVNFIQCASNPADNAPTFASMPQLIAGHEYILLVSHYTDSQSGYSLSFGGGNAVITDPTEPHLQSVSTDCDGQTLTIKLNKNIKCNSLTASGSEFSLIPAVTTVISATPGTSCNTGFDMEEITLRLAAPLPAGNYQIVINPGTDANSLLDNCDRGIPAGEQLSFQYIVPQPIFADSVSSPGCAPQSITVYFPKKIDCRTIAADGSDFAVTGPSAVTVLSANGNCSGNETDSIVVRFSAPIVLKGLYTLRLKTGVDGTTIVDECGLELPTQTMQFTCVDTVSAAFTYTSQLDCRFNTLLFSHDGAHDVNTWNWMINNTPSTTRTQSMVFPASSSNNVQLIVTNGVCSDTTSQVVVMDNEVIAAFDAAGTICPEDLFEITNNSTGLIDQWRWTMDAIGTSNLKTPAPYLYPVNAVDRTYSVKLVATNSTLGCSDSIRKTVKVFNNCFIAVPSAFTPNGDGLNDFLYPNNAIKANNLEFKVFNRWGQLVFQSKDWTSKWDGKIKGVLQSPGVFVWHLRYTHSQTGQKVFQKGTTTLIL